MSICLHRNLPGLIVFSGFLLFIFLNTAVPVYGYKILYAEQYYKLYHRNLYQYPEDFNENIWYLERALERPFVNPQNALARISNSGEWERYRYLFALHVNLKLVEQYRFMAGKYDKRTAFFYNAPWREQNLKSLEIAESYYIAALYYWEKALDWWEYLAATPYFHLREIQHWEDEWHRIGTGELDYEKFILLDLERLYRVRDEFLAMDETTY